jgi:tRNA-splicing ligase RtcB
MAKEEFRGPLEKVDECCYRIPRSYKPGMRVDGLIFTDEKLLRQLKLDQAPEQVANVAFLPGIQHASLAGTSSAAPRCAASCPRARPTS